MAMRSVTRTRFVQDPTAAGKLKWQEVVETEVVPASETDRLTLSRAQAIPPAAKAPELSPSAQDLYRSMAALFSAPGA